MVCCSLIAGQPVIIMAEGGHVTIDPGVINRFTECPVCLAKIKNHRCLPCMHAFCHDCLVPLVQGRTISCPLCREPCTLKAGGVTELPKSPLLVEVLGRVCEECLERNKDIYCDHCDRRLCTPCKEKCAHAIALQDMLDSRSVELEEIENQKLKIIAQMKEIQSVIDNRDKEQMKSTISKMQKTGDNRKAYVSTSELRPNANTIQKIHEATGRLARIYLSKHTCRELFRNAGLIRPTHVAVSNISGRIAVINKWHNAINLFDNEHQLIRQLGSGGHATGQFEFGALDNSGGVCFTSEDHIAVADTENHRIQLLAAQGIVVRVIGSEGTGPGQFQFPKGIAAHEGKLYVPDCNNQRIQVLGEDGTFLMKFGTEDVMGLWWPHFVAVCDNGDIIVASAQSEYEEKKRPQFGRKKKVITTGKLDIFESDGHHKNTICMGEVGSVQLQYPSCVTPVGNNNLIVTDTATHQVHIVTHTGHLVQTFGSHGSKLGQFDCPVGVACTKDGSAYVVDCGNSRLQVFRM